MYFNVLRLRFYWYLPSNQSVRINYHSQRRHRPTEQTMIIFSLVLLLPLSVLSKPKSDNLYIHLHSNRSTPGEVRLGRRWNPVSRFPWTSTRLNLKGHRSPQKPRQVTILSLEAFHRFTEKVTSLYFSTLLETREYSGRIVTFERLFISKWWVGVGCEMIIITNNVKSYQKVWQEANTDNTIIFI